MSWLLFLDESGHDHQNMPYEVRGGLAVHASKLWALIRAVQTLEQSCFGAHLHQYGSEIKGSKLLDRDRFKWSHQAPPLDPAARRKNALNFLNDSRQGRVPRRHEFTAYGQACIAMAEGIIERLRSHEARLFAAIIPKVNKPADQPAEYLRKDQVLLLERYFYFLEHRQEMGLLVMDGTEKTADRRFVRRLERYFTLTMTGVQRTQWIVPAPLFVEPDVVYGVQMADLCIHILNWACRLPGMTEPKRPVIEPFYWLLEGLIWRGDGYRGGQVFRTHGVVYVPDPYGGR